MAELKSDVLKAAMLLDSLSPGVLQAVRELLALRDKEGRGYVDVVELIRRTEPALLLAALEGASPADSGAVLAALQPEGGAALLAAWPRPFAAEAVTALAGLDAVKAMAALRKLEPRLVKARIVEGLGVGRRQAMDLLQAAPDIPAEEVIRLVAAALPDLGRALTDEVYTISRLSGFPDPALREALATLSHREIGVALRGAPEPVRGKLLSVLSPRVREIVEEETKASGRACPSAEESESARKALKSAAAAAVARLAQGKGPGETR